MNLGVTIVIVIMAAIICILWGELNRLHGQMAILNSFIKQIGELQEKKKAETKNFFDILADSMRQKEAEERAKKE